MKRLIVSVLVMGILPQFVFGTALPISEGDVVKVQFNSALVGPFVGGIEIQAGTTKMGYNTPYYDDGVWVGCYLADIRDASNTQIATAYKAFSLNVITETRHIPIPMLVLLPHQQLLSGCGVHTMMKYLPMQ